MTFGCLITVYPLLVWYSWLAPEGASEIMCSQTFFPVALQLTSLTLIFFPKYSVR